MTLLYYLAYGSNLHPVRLTERVPSARFLGLTSLFGYQLRFHKRHEPDGSGKCNMYHTDTFCLGMQHNDSDTGTKGKCFYNITRCI